MHAFPGRRRRRPRSSASSTYSLVKLIAATAALNLAPREELRSRMIESFFCADIPPLDQTDTYDACWRLVISCQKLVRRSQQLHLSQTRLFKRVAPAPRAALRVVSCRSTSGRRAKKSQLHDNPAARQLRRHPCRLLQGNDLRDRIADFPVARRTSVLPKTDVAQTFVGSIPTAGQRPLLSPCHAGAAAQSYFQPPTEKSPAFCYDGQALPRNKQSAGY